MNIGSFDSSPRRPRAAIRGSFVALASLCLIAGCANPRQAYVAQHPNLTAEHRKIITAGKIVDRDAVAGMTREEIQLTMGVEATQSTTINGEDVLVWVKRKPEPLSMMDGTDRASSSGSGSGSFSNLPRETDQVPTKKVNIRTTVFFHGDYATRVDVREDPAGPAQ